MPVRDLTLLLKTLDPVLNSGSFAFVSVGEQAMLQSIKVLASIQEPEGYSAIISQSDAIVLNLLILFEAAWITLSVNSDLHAVGLTAAVAAALAKENISCNVVAGAVHDHLFVPIERAADTMRVLKQLQDTD